jgi:Carbohydrate esterase 2 N-terminal/GDSL-like Lipase/Acylhydrolase
VDVTPPIESNDILWSRCSIQPRSIKDLSPLPLSFKTSIALAIFGSFLSAAFAQSVNVKKAEGVNGLAPLSMSIGGRVLSQPEAGTEGAKAGSYKYQWPGTYFTASLKGQEAYFRVGEGKQILHVIVDDASPVILVRPDPGMYRISGLSDGVHAVRIEVVTESQAGPDTFGGFALLPSASPLPAPHRSRQIEFIGDSHTVGYGNMSLSRQCSADEIWATTDNSQAFGPVTAKHYKADYQINAISGHGVVRNYNGSPGDPMPVAYPYVLFDKMNRYEDQSWHPQIVVSALGTNDFSTALNPGEKWKSRDELHADYEATYVHFLHSLRVRYPDAFFILWATDAANGEISAEVEKVVLKLKAERETRVAFIPVKDLSMTGCDWHPSIADDKIISGLLIDFIDKHPEIWRGK